MGYAKENLAYNYMPDSMFRQAVDAVEEYKSELMDQAEGYEDLKNGE